MDVFGRAMKGFLDDGKCGVLVGQKLQWCWRENFGVKGMFLCVCVCVCACVRAQMLWGPRGSFGPFRVCYVMLSRDLCEEAVCDN